MPTFHYVYILVSLEDPARHYVGTTEDIAARLAKHRPWRIETWVCERARENRSDQKLWALLGKRPFSMSSRYFLMARLAAAPRPA